MRVFIYLLLGSLFYSASAHAQQTNQKFVSETGYLLYLPDGYQADTVRKWPLVMFLHGSGESGSDLEKVKFHGPPQLAAQGKKFPFILVSPQAEVPGGWDVSNLYKLLQFIKRNYRVDASRVYLTGLSMGGYGTWKLAMEHPEEFAAIAPVCGGGDTSMVWKLRNMPVWCFHGAKDNVVPPSQSINMVSALRKVNPSVKFTLYPEANHNSWDSAYNSNDSLYDWMLAQRKFSYREVPIKAALLRKYEGAYRSATGDTVQIFLRNDTLMAKTPHETLPLRPINEKTFFLLPEVPMDIQFLEDRKEIYGFEFKGNERVLFRKVKTKK